VTAKATGLSEQQVAYLKAGRGMGLALPAELNGYPGPAHVLSIRGLQLIADERDRLVERRAVPRGRSSPWGQRSLVTE
jgi:hypothetical protein